MQTPSSMRKLRRKPHHQQMYERSRREAKVCSMQRKSQGRINTLRGGMQAERNSRNHSQHHPSSISVPTIAISPIRSRNITNPTAHHYTGNQSEPNTDRA